MKAINALLSLIDLTFSIVLLAIIACLLSTGCAAGMLDRGTLTNSKGGDGGSNKSKHEPVGFGRSLTQGRSLEDAGKWDDARKIYEKLIIDYPDRPEAYHRLAVVADRTKRHREAQALYSEALRIKPGDPELFNDLGWCFYLQGQLEKAESALSKAVSLAPSNRIYRNNLGLIYGQQGRLNEALETFRRAGSEADAQYNLAFVLASRQDFDGAKRCFQVAIAADPNHELARRAVRSFQKFENDPNGVWDNSELVEGGVRWVPYVENQQPESAAESKVVQAGGKSSSTVSSSAGPNTRALQDQVRTMMHERMSTRAAD